MPRMTSRFWLIILLALGTSLPLSAEIAFYGDTQANPRIHARIVDAIAARRPELAFHLGDLTQRGSEQKHYDAFWQLERPLADICPIYPARGNHDRSRDLFLANFPALNGCSYYSLVHDSLKFIVVDATQDLKPGSEQYRWLQQELATGAQLPAILVMHYPVFGSVGQFSDQSLELFMPGLLAGSRVVAVISGHNHVYERLFYQGVTYLISGGGGGALHQRKTAHPFSQVFYSAHNYLILDRQGKTLTFTAHGLDGQILDTTRLELP